MIFFQKTKNVLVAFFVLFFLIFSFQVVLADENSPEDTGYGLTESAKKSGLNKGETDISVSVGNVIGALLSFIGILFFILMIYAGFLWMTARGNDEQVTKAISIMMQASIGLIIVAAAYLITRFVGETVIGAFISEK